MTRPKTQPPTCTIPDCDRPAIARILCTLHYTRWQRHGTTDKPAPKPLAPTKTCTVDGCDKPQRCRRMCSTHYTRWQRHHNPTTVLTPANTNGCTIDGCERKHWARGWCGLHYRRWQRHGDPLVAKGERKRVTPPEPAPPEDPPEHLTAWILARRARLGRNNAA